MKTLMNIPPEWRIPVFVAGVIVCLFCRVLYVAMTGGPQPIITSDTPVDLRGNTVMLMRLPSTVVPAQQIDITDDHLAVRNLLLPTGQLPARYTLTEQEWGDFTRLRNQWCEQTPTFLPRTADEPFYRIGLRCSGYDTKQIDIPVDQVPLFFTHLQDRVPQLSLVSDS